MSTQLYNVNCQYNKSSNEAINVADTSMGDLIIDAAGKKLVTHHNEFKFMDLADDYSNPTSEQGISTVGAFLMMSYMNEHSIMDGVSTIKEAIDRLVEILAEDAPSALTSKYVSLEIVGDSVFYKNVSTEITFKVTLNEYPYTIDTLGLTFNDGTEVTDLWTLPLATRTAATYQYTKNIKQTTDLVATLAAGTNYTNAKGVAPSPNTITVTATATAKDVPAISAKLTPSVSTINPDSPEDVIYTLEINEHPIAITSIKVNGEEMEELPIVGIAYREIAVEHKAVAVTETVTVVITDESGQTATIRATVTAKSVYTAYAWIQSTSQTEEDDINAINSDGSATVMTYDGSLIEGVLEQPNYSAITTDNTYYISTTPNKFEMTLTAAAQQEKINASETKSYLIFWALPEEVTFDGISTGLMQGDKFSNGIHNYGKITVNGDEYYLYRYMSTINTAIEGQQHILVY